MKRILLSLLLAVSLLVTVLPLGVSADEKSPCSEITSGTNEGANAYTYYWSQTVGSYLVKVKTGGYMSLVQNGDYYIQYYSDAFSFTGKKTVKAELPIFGAFYETEDNYYIVSGQENPEENDETEVYRITKYDKSWNRLSSCGLFGENTYIPFDAGNCRVAECGKYLLIRTCHEMYQSSDGYHHQANVQIEIDTETMTVTDSFTIIMNSSRGYVSHSFNQFVKVEDGVLYGVDHGDAYPRKVCLIEYSNKCDEGMFYSTNCKVYSFLDIAGAIGKNYTGCEVGGFEITSDAFLCAGKTIKQDGNSYTTSNIFVSSIDKATRKTTLNMITDYAEGTSSPENPQLVKISDNRLVLMWMREGKLNYVTLDGNGNPTGEIKTANGNLSDCQPIISGNNIVWFSYNGAKTTFYTLSADNLKFSAKTSDYSHVYTISKQNADGTVTEICNNCGKTVTGKIPTSLTCYWLSSQEGYVSYWSTAFSSDVHPGDEKEFSLYAEDCDIGFDDVKVTVSDENVCKVEGDSVIIVGTGKATITFTSVFNPSLVKTYTVYSYHPVESMTETRKASCSREGEMAGVCSVCNETITKAIPKTAHTEVAISATPATCGKAGATAGVKCSVCNAVIKAPETIPATGKHSWDSGKVTIEPTDEKEGEKTYTCTVCGEIKNVKISNKTKTILLGDIDGQEGVSVSDARLILRAAIRLEKLEGDKLIAADVDGSGKLAPAESDITVSDARLALRMAIKLDKEETVEIG